MTQFLFWNWLGGLLDGDGCFTISLQKQHNSLIPRLNIWFQVTVNLKETDLWILEFIKQNTKIGSIYHRQRNTGYPMTSWQTTNFKDSIYITEKVLPFLMLKKERAKKFLILAKYWNQTANPDRNKSIEMRGKSRWQGDRMRTQKDILKAIKIACEINPDRQQQRYKNKLTYEQWEPLIKEWYPK